MLQMIAVDLDGTLLDSRGKIDSVTACTLQEIDELGLHFVLATGRHLREARHFGEALRIQAYLISSNGARVHDPAGGQIFAEDLPPAVARALMSPALAQGVLIGAFSDESWLLSHPCPALEAHAIVSGFGPQVQDLAAHDGTGISMVAYMGAREEVARLEADILERFGGRVCLTVSSDRTLEVVAHSISKGRSLADILVRVGVPPSGCVAFGDGPNDIEMLSLVGRPFVMSRSSPRLLAALPDVPSAGSNDHAGVALTLRDLLGLPSLMARS